MPTNMVDGAGAPRTITANGKKYRITPIEFSEWAKYVEWLRDTYVSFVKRNAADLETKLRESLIREAFAKGPTLDTASPEIASTMNSPAGLFKLAMLHLRPEHPDITDADIARIFESDEMQEQLRKKIDGTLPNEPVAKKKTPRKKGSTKAQKRPAKRRKKR